MEGVVGALQKLANDGCGLIELIACLLAYMHGRLVAFGGRGVGMGVTKGGGTTTHICICTLYLDFVLPEQGDERLHCSWGLLQHGGGAWACVEGEGEGCKEDGVWVATCLLLSIEMTL